MALQLDDVHRLSRALANERITFENIEIEFMPPLNDALDHSRNITFNNCTFVAIEGN